MGRPLQGVAANWTNSRDINSVSNTSHAKHFLVTRFVVPTVCERCFEKTVPLVTPVPFGNYFDTGVMRLD